MAEFYLIRASLALMSSLCEAYFLSSLSRHSRRLALYTLPILLLSPGMFISSSAMLPSSFSMSLVMLFFGLWLRDRRAACVYALALPVLIGWPFVGAIGIPIAIEMVFLRGEMMRLLAHGVAALAVILTPIVMADEYFYGRVVVAPWNVAMYNVIGGEGRGPGLYGEEPWTFYVKNGFLNFNIAFFLAIASFVIVVRSLQFALYYFA